MKKITLALCACAFALTGLLASCSNESTSVNYVNVGSHSNQYKYAVRGTVKTTTDSSYKSDNIGMPDQNGKLTTSSTVTEAKITNGKVDVSFYTDENEESNYTNYSLLGSYNYTVTTTNTNTLYGEKASGSKGSSSGTEQLSLPSIKQINDEYYFVEDGVATKIEEYAISEDDDAFDGEFGGEFSLNIKFTKSLDFDSYLEMNGMKNNFSYSGDLEDTDAYKNYKEMIEKYGFTATSTTEYKLTFYPLQDFDPNEEVEEDEE